jgi:hypothetical protein
VTESGEDDDKPSAVDLSSAPPAVSAPVGPVRFEPLDLTEQEPSAPARPLSYPAFSAARTVTVTRIWLAGSLVGVLAVLTLGTAWFVVRDPKAEPAVEAFLKLVFTPIIGLVGSVVGFYFGAQSGKDTPGG